MTVTKTLSKPLVHEEKIYILMQKYGINCVSHLASLWFLRDGRILQMSELAKLCGVTSAAITGITDSLHKAGLIQKVPAPREGDRRRIYATITELGEEFITGLYLVDNRFGKKHIDWYQQISHQLDTHGFGPLALGGCLRVHKNIIGADFFSRLEWSHASGTQTIDRLEDHGLLTRTVCPEDRRLKILSLTPEGREIFTRP